MVSLLHPVPRHLRHFPAMPARRCRTTAVRVPPVTLLVVALVAGLLLAGGCSSDGRELAVPDPDLTATTPPTTAPPTTAAPVMALTSPAFVVDGTLPARFTCTGADVSPPLSISSVPDGTESLTVALTDPDAGGFVHWVATGIDPGTTALRAGELPSGTVEYPNDFGDAAYQGPCPPRGDRHRYTFTLYAVPPSAAALVSPDETNGQAVLDLLSTLARTTASIGVAYERPAA